MRLEYMEAIFEHDGRWLVQMPGRHRAEDYGLKGMTRLNFLNHWGGEGWRLLDISRDEDARERFLFIRKDSGGLD